MEILIQRFCRFLLTFGFLTVVSFSVFSQKKNISADEVLQKTSAKLNSLKFLKFNYRQEYNYASQGYFDETKAEIYYEFTPSEPLIGLKYQYNGQDRSGAFNGSELFDMWKKNKIIDVQPTPSIVRLSRSTFLQFSPLTLKNALPKILADKTITKSVSETIIGIQDCYLVEFSLNKAYFNTGTGDEILPLKGDFKTIYRVTIRKNDFMPIEFYRGTSANQDFNKTSYSEIIENPPPPPENTWYYSNYLNDYKYAQPPKDNFIKAGETAPEFNLPLVADNKNISLTDYKGKIVLLDFFIYHCGYCQAAVPTLNSLQKKYKGKDLKILGVNINDSKDLIQLFIRNTRAEFAIVSNGRETAEKYGVFSYPKYVLVGVDGKVLYSGGYDQTVIEKLIDSFLSN